MSRVRTISLSPPMRDRPGFGCPGCGAPLPTDTKALRWASVLWLPCCGYQPTLEESRRWALAGQRLDQEGSR